MFIDSHAHLDDKKFARDLDRVISRASDSGVERIVTVGDSVESSRKAIALAHRNEKIYATVGIHPKRLCGLKDGCYEDIARLAEDPRVVAIGEVGLDYHYNKADRSEQKDALRRQIRLAREIDLPMVAHCRDAYEDLLKILKEEKVSEIGGVVHCFSGSPDDAKRIVDMDWHIGIGGPLTFPHADALREAVAATPNDRILIETDCPYLPPQTKRGRRNEPSYLKFVVKALADLKELSFQDMARITKMNTIRLFSLPVRIPPEVAYSIRKSLYLNITNSCTNNCYFCHRQRDYGYGGYNLRLEGEPTRDEIMKQLKDVGNYEEVVFCGIGEPTLRLDLVLEIAAKLKKKGVRLRLNTNGQGSLVHGEDIVAKLAGLFDAVSISLNAATAEEYNAISRPAEPGKAFKAIIDFAKRAKKAIPEVSLTVVGAPKVDIEACRALAEEELKIPLRVREFVPPPQAEAEIFGHMS